MPMELTGRTNKVMDLARKSAKFYNHDSIKVEDLLLGLIAEGGGIAMKVFKKLGLDPADVTHEIERFVSSGSQESASGTLSNSQQVEKVLEYAEGEERTIKHNYLGTENILLGLLQVPEGVTAEVFGKFGITIEKTRSEIYMLLSST